MSEVSLLPTSVLRAGLETAVALRWELAWALIKIMDANRLTARLFGLTPANSAAAVNMQARYDAVTADVRRLERMLAVRRG